MFTTNITGTLTPATQFSGSCGQFNMTNFKFETATINGFMAGSTLTASG